MTKIATLISSIALVTASSMALAANAPAGFGGSEAKGGPAGFDNQKAVPMQFTKDTAPNSVELVLANGQDDQRVTLTGKLTNYLGQDRYEFTDATGRMIVELDDDKNWSHLRKDQLITIYGEVDRDFNSVEIDVKEARAAL